MKVKLIPVTNFGREEYKPANELAENIAIWIKKAHLSKRDLEFIELIGLETVILTYQ